MSLQYQVSTSLHYIYIFYHNFDKEGPGGADIYIPCLEDFVTIGGSSMFQIPFSRTFQKFPSALPASALHGIFTLLA